MAKRDAELKMREALGDQADLRQDLMNVLIHTDAKWAPDDFDFDRPGLVARPAPPFLQPDHQPQMRLPPICPSWYADHQVHQSTSPAVLDGYGGHQGFGHSVSPLMHQIPNQFHYPNAFTSPISTESARHASYTSTNYEEERSPANLQFDHDHVQIAWEGEDHGHGKPFQRFLKALADELHLTLLQILKSIAASLGRLLSQTHCLGVHDLSPATT
jgi:hypothetical protein